jgi:putative restriction endonuclease
MDKASLLRKISDLSIWRRRDQRAPHKPLLILLYLGKLQANEPRLAEFSDIEDKLERLLREFGPSRKSYHPEHPFSRLRTDDIWELSVDTPSDKLTKKRLREGKVKGGFSEPVFELLKKDQGLANKISAILLEAHFPGETYHQDILDAVGLDNPSAINVDSSVTNRKVRDPDFRGRILKVYDYRCAICDFDVRIGTTPVALEAAHIKWHTAGGPDEEKNGLALCTLHHKLLDRGAIGISDDNKVIVSDEANGNRGFEDWVLRFQGKTLRAPRRVAYMPGKSYVKWHMREVFKGGYGC